MDLVLNGFDDWFLPSIDALVEMYNKIGQGASPPNTNIGGFEDGAYWSSSQSDASNAILVQFTTGSNPSFQKSNALRVRAIRRF